MNIETITIPPVPVKPTKTYVVTLTEVEARALKTLTGMQSGATIEKAAKIGSFNTLKEDQLETVRIVSDKLYDALNDVGVDDLTRK